MKKSTGHFNYFVVWVKSKIISWGQTRFWFYLKPSLIKFGLNQDLEDTLFSIKKLIVWFAVSPIKPKNMGRIKSTKLYSHSAVNLDLKSNFGKLIYQYLDPLNFRSIN